MPPIGVLVVDDSIVVRKILRDALASTPEIAVVGTASSGTIALAKIPLLNPDVVTLDIEMPGLDGIQTLTQIRKLYPKLPVIMFSTLTERGAAITLQALALGASDYLAKPSNTASLASAMEQVQRELVAKIMALTGRRLAAARPVTTPAPTPTTTPTTTPVVTPVVTPAGPVIPLRRRSEGVRIEILAIGTSTGGPNALDYVIPRLPGDFPVPVVLVQHMPPLFTRLLSERLNGLSQIRVQEAEAGRMLAPGHVWIAPGNFHMTVARKGTEVFLHLNQDPTENGCRPAVDVLFRSVARTYGPNALAVVMTGMGSDGARGSAQIREAGGEILVQDEASSVVWGMPGAVVEAGLADKICPLNEISGEIIRRVNSSKKQPLSVSAPASV